MSENCNGNCDSCQENCSSRKQSFKIEQNKLSNVKNVIAVVSGKGGVGKTLVTSLLAVLLKRQGFNTAILDGDITGSSITKMFGLHQKEVEAIDENTMLPVKTKTGIKVMSINLFLESDSDPVVWRGPVLAGAIKQFWTDVAWTDIDYMFVDMPPGTGDIPLTVFQSLPLKGIVVVTSPQELATDIVAKALKMAQMMNIPVLGLVENMAYFECDNCQKKHYIYGESHLHETAKEYNIETVSSLPINKIFAELSDAGRIEDVTIDVLEEMVEKLINLYEVLE